MVFFMIRFTLYIFGENALKVIFFLLFSVNEIKRNIILIFLSISDTKYLVFKVVSTRFLHYKVTNFNFWIYKKKKEMYLETARKA